MKWTPEKIRKAARAANRATATLRAEHPHVYADTYKQWRTEQPDIPRSVAQHQARRELKIRYPQRYAELYRQYKKEEGLE